MENYYSFSLSNLRSAHDQNNVVRCTQSHALSKKFLFSYPLIYVFLTAFRWGRKLSSRCLLINVKFWFHSNWRELIYLLTYEMVDSSFVLVTPKSGNCLSLMFTIIFSYSPKESRLCTLVSKWIQVISIHVENCSFLSLLYDLRFDFYAFPELIYPTTVPALNDSN